jgi:hypothetical protein
LKRFCFMLFALAALASVAVPAQAGKWVTKEIKWRLSNQGGPSGATAIWVRDTTHAVFGGAALDTSASFSLDDALLPPFPLASPHALGLLATASQKKGPDSLGVAYVVIQQDSAATGTITAGNGVTMRLDGRVRVTGPAVNNSRGWIVADSLVAASTNLAADPIVFAVVSSSSPYGPLARFAELRLRTVTDAELLPAARIYLRYYTKD